SKASLRLTGVSSSMRKRWTGASSGCSNDNACPLDAFCCRRFRTNLRIPPKTFTHLAHRTVVNIYERVRSLKTLPHRGRPGRKEGTRELVMAPLPYLRSIVLRGNLSRFYIFTTVRENARKSLSINSLF